MPHSLLLFMRCTHLSVLLLFVNCLIYDMLFHTFLMRKHNCVVKWLRAANYLYKREGQNRCVEGTVSTAAASVGLVRPRRPVL
jgi:hypothetical protein